jgi:hypothetical protein
MINNSGILNWSFLCLIVLLVSCQPKSDKPEIPETIPIDGGNFNEITFNNILTDISLTPLQTSPECMIGEQFRVLDSDRDFFIMDEVSKLIFRFDADGHFLNIIGKKGKGPGEYNDMYEAIVSDKGVELLTGFPTTEVTYYTKEDSFIERRKFMEYASLSFFIQPRSNDYLFYGSGYAHKIQRIEQKSGEIVDSMLVNTGGSKVFRVHPFTKTSYGTILFCELFINKIYEINPDGIKEKYRLDLGKYSIEQDLTARDFMKRAGETGVWSIDRALENDDYLYIGISRYMPDDTSSKSHFIYRKSDKKIFILSEKDTFSAAFGPAYHIDKNGDLFMPLKPAEAMNCKAWTGYFDANKSNIRADDNPVMVKLNIKSIINKIQ